MKLPAAHELKAFPARLAQQSSCLITTAELLIPQGISCLLNDPEIVIRLATDSQFIAILPTSRRNLRSRHLNALMVRHLNCRLARSLRTSCLKEVFWTSDFGKAFKFKFKDVIDISWCWLFHMWTVQWSVTNRTCYQMFKMRDLASWLMCRNWPACPKGS